MAKDDLAKLAGKVHSKMNDENKIDKSDQKPVMLHIGYYKLLKVYCALHGESMVGVSDKAFQKLLDEGFFNDVKNLVNK